MPIDDKTRKCAKIFVNQRFKSIRDGAGIMPLPTKDGILIMHLVPLPDFEKERRIDVVKIKDVHEKHRCFNAIVSSDSTKINLDGYCAYYSGKPHKEYTQIFRNGVIESASTSLFGHHDPIGFMFASQKLSGCLVEALNNYMEGMHALKAKPPILLQISMMGVKGLNIGLNRINFDSLPPYDRDVMHLPASVIDKFREDENYQSVMAEQMHFLWNAFDLERCSYFNENDEWAPPN